MCACSAHEKEFPLKKISKFFSSGEIQPKFLINSLNSAKERQ
jgi:hypothetical protein